MHMQREVRCRFFEATHRTLSYSQVIRRLNPLLDGLVDSDEDERTVHECVEELKLTIGERQPSSAQKPLRELGDHVYHQMAEQYFNDPRYTLMDLLWKENPLVNCKVTSYENKPKPTTILFRPSDESRMLVQYGPRRSPRVPSLTIESPPCMRRNLCVGVTAQLRGAQVGGGFILMARMTPDELKDHEMTGAVPKRLRMTGPEMEQFFKSNGAIAPFSYVGTLCVLCSRHEMSRLIIGNLANQHEPSPEMIRQWHRVTTDCRDGYNSLLCWSPVTRSLQTGLTHPIPQFRHDLLEAYKDKDDVWWVNQDKMLHVAVDKKRDYPHGIRAMPAATPRAPEAGSKRAADMRLAVTYKAQLFRVRSSLSSPGLLRSEHAKTDSLQKKLSGSSPHTADMLKTPLFLLTNYWHLFTQRKEDKSTSTHKREPLFELVAKCFPTLDPPQANTLPQRFAKLYKPLVFLRGKEKRKQTSSERKRIFHECAFPMARLWLLEWSILYYKPTTSSKNLWHNRYDPSKEEESKRDAWFKTAYSNGRQIIAMLRYFLVFAAQVIPALDHLLTQKGGSDWKRYRELLESLKKQYSLDVYNEMLAHGSRLASALCIAPPFLRTFHRTLIPSKTARIREFLPPDGQLFKLKANEQTQTQQHPVVSLVRHCMNAPVSCPAICRNHSAWGLFRRLSLLSAFVFERTPSNHFFDTLALLCVTHFHPRCNAREWSEVLRSLFKPNKQLGEFLAVVFKQLHSTFSVALPVDCLKRQVEAAHLRFLKCQDFRSEGSAWVRSTLVRDFGMPPADMLVVCPRCQGVHCMVNAFVCAGSGKLKTRRSDEVSGFPGVLVEPLFDSVTCRRRDGTRASDCMATNLHALPILGKIQVYDNRIYCICARPKCAMITELSQDIWPGFWPMDENGDLVCSSCFMENAKGTEEKLSQSVSIA